MDAATLFLVLTLPSGHQHFTAREYDSLAECEAHAASYRDATRYQALPPGVRMKLLRETLGRVSTSGIGGNEPFVCETVPTARRVAPAAACA